MLYDGHENCAAFPPVYYILVTSFHLTFFITSCAMIKDDRSAEYIWILWNVLYIKLHLIPNYYITNSL